MIHKRREAMNNIDLIFAETRLIRGMNSFDISLSIFDEFFPVEAFEFAIKAIIRTIFLNGIRNLSGIPHDFFRHTADIDTCATQITRFNQSTFFAIRCSTIHRCNSATPSTNCNIVIMFRHEGPRSIFKLFCLRCTLACKRSK